MKIELMMKPPGGTELNSPEARPWVDLYLEFSNWWTAHGWNAVPVNCLPALGAYVTDGETKLAAAWLYQDNSSPVCMLEWLVSNPDVAPLVSVKAIKKLIEYFQFEAKALGYEHMIAACKLPALVRVYQSTDFKITDDGMTHLIHNLQE